MRVEQGEEDSEPYADFYCRARRTPLFGQAEERGGYESVDVDGDEQPAGHVQHEVEREDVKLAHEVAVHVHLVLVEQVVAEQTKVQDECVAHAEHREIGERGMNAHLVTQQHEQRQQVADRAENDPQKGDVLLQHVD